MTRSACTTVDFTAYRRQKERQRRRERLYFLLAILPQRLCIAILTLYCLLRFLLAPEVPFSYYTGPLAMLWPLAFLSLLTSYISDCFLWDA